MRVRRSRRKLARNVRSSPSSASAAIGLGVAALAAVPAANAATFDVTSNADSGAGTLRQAVLDANAAAGPDVITFDSAVTGLITLTSGEIRIYDSVDIQGPGESVLSISGDDASRVFYIYTPSLAADIDVQIADLTITNGNDVLGGGGGGISLYLASLTLDRVTITQSQSACGPATIRPN
jgi:hypothetical protein